MATGTSGGDAVATVNWSVRLDPADAESWDDLQHALRRETGRRTLTKAALFRALIDTVEKDPAARRRLVEILAD